MDPGLDICPDGKRCPLGTRCLAEYNVCITATCGDGIVQNVNGESCDFGGINTDTCDSDCSLPECGDGFVNPEAGEECDDGGDSEACNRNCTYSVCGDGVLNPASDEECDDGNADDTDSCVLECHVARCGDGTVQRGLEECDSGVGATADCDEDCTRVACGDGVVNVPAGEQCDDGDESAACDSDCTYPVCGDGVFNESAGEGCDDGNGDDGDGCVDQCQVARCGDGYVLAGVEACDDGNADDSDDCTSSCEYAACDDGIVNGDEIDVDCGGHCGARSCRIRQVCMSGDDCHSGICRIGLCAAGRLAAGNQHTCLVLETGAVRCWGSGSSGQLGYANTDSIGQNQTPASAGDVFVGGSVIQITAGQRHSCALLGTGSIRCWGLGVFGSLGYGNTLNIGDDETPSSAGDVDVGGFIAQIASGDHHNCTTLDNGSVRCWGRGSTGRLGYGNTDTVGDDENPSTAGDVNVGAQIVQIATGVVHTCALSNIGKIRCWGRNGGYGYDGSDIGDDESPASAGYIDMGGTAVQIGAGDNYTCALLASGTVRCWGRSNYGQLGYGNTSTVYASDAEDVDVGGTVVQIAVGRQHMCALLEAGTVRCWGNGGWGRLGYGNTDNIGDNEAPSTVGDVDVDGTVVEIAAGGNHTCILLET